MITDLDGRRVYSNFGWVDHGSLWVFDADAGQETNVLLSGARYLSLVAGAAGYFAIVHHFDGARILVTVQTYKRPDLPVASVDVRGWQPTSSGETATWMHVPSAYVGYLNDAATGSAGYYVVRIENGDPSVSRLDWFDGDTYDLAYQGVVGVAVVPESRQLLFGIQRSSDLVLCSPDGAAVVRTVRLSGHLGNPTPQFRKTAREVLATNYDTLVCLDYQTWNVARDYHAGGSEERQMFVGDAWWPPTEEYVVLPRPGVGDVLVLGMEDLVVRQQVRIGRQPLAAVVLPGGTVVARDWKTGDFLASLPNR